MAKHEDFLAQPNLLSRLPRENAWDTMDCVDVNATTERERKRIDNKTRRFRILLKGGIVCCVQKRIKGEIGGAIEAVFPGFRFELLNENFEGYYKQISN